MSYKEQRAWSLLNSLRREVRSKVLRKEHKICLQKQVITTVQWLYKLGIIGTGMSHTFYSRVRSEGGETQSKTELKD
jgi:hypothetical protein